MLARLTDKKIDLIAGIVFAIVLVLIAFGQISYNDFFWHLALGKWMIATRSFLTHDIFSYTFYGKEWLNSTWLFDGVLYLIYRYGSFIGLNLLRLAMLAGTYFFFAQAAQVKRSASLALALGILMLTLPSLRSFYRPEITQPFFVGYFLYSLYSYAHGRSKKLLYSLPIVELLWVNTHGSFHFGPILISIFLASELIRQSFGKSMLMLPSDVIRDKRLRTYLLVLLLTLGATLINPYGLRLYVLLAGILADKESLLTILEWFGTPIPVFFQVPAECNRHSSSSRLERVRPSC